MFPERSWLIPNLNCNDSFIFRFHKMYVIIIAFGTDIVSKVVVL